MGGGCLDAPEVTYSPLARRFVLRCDWQGGDELIGHGNTRWRVVAVVHDAPPEYGRVAVEPV